jgi:hypothetical protein
VGLIRNIKIHINGIPYFITLTVFCNIEVSDVYSMLWGKCMVRCLTFGARGFTTVHIMFCI